MRKTCLVKQVVRIRLYPNKTQQIWLDCNFQNAIDYHNYLLANIYEDDVEIDEETGEEKDVIRINWDTINSKYGLATLQSKFHYALRNVTEDRIRTDRNNLKITQYYRGRTIENIYDQVCNDVKKNFCTFYRDGKGKPRFKSNRGRVTFRMPQNSRDLHLVRRKDEMNHDNGFDFKINRIEKKHSSKLSHNLGWLHIPSCGAGNDNADDFIKCFAPCNISKEDISSITFIREASGKYYATIVLRIGRVYLFKKQALDDMLCEKQVGVDINLSPKTRVVTSTFQGDVTEFKFEQKEEIIQAPTPYKDYFSKLRKEQRSLSRKVKFSKNWFKQKQKVAHIHEKIANIRLNFNRQTAAYLTKNYQSIAIEDLSITQMKRGQPRWFQKLYNDANLYQLRQCIRWSCLKTGRELNYVSPEHTSKTCHDCWYTNHDLKLGQSSWVCPNCGVIHHRDRNAARNIYSLAWAYDEVEGELLENQVTYDPFEERQPVNNLYFLENLSKRIGEEVTTVSA